MAARVPKTRCSETMTEAAFFSFIRSGLRMKSQRWKPAYDAKKLAQRPYTGDDKRTRFVYLCAICDKTYKDKEVQIDHIVPCGSLKSFSDLPEFCRKLFCEVDGYRVLCVDCHQKVTNEAREGVKYEQT